MSNRNSTNELRCMKCNKKLAEGVAVKLMIKCPRCGHVGEYGVRRQDESKV